jgi:putative phosphoesterase
MRIALVSDTHGDPTAWRKAMDVLGPVDLITHAGDVLYHGIFNPITETYEPRRLADVLNKVSTPMIHARGNCDSEVDQLALNNHMLSDFAFASADGVRILVTHGHKHSEEQLAEMARKARVQIVHRGHTHQPQILVLKGVVIFNAGSIALPKQEGETPTVGLLEDGKLTIFDINTGAVFEEGFLPTY